MNKTLIYNSLQAIIQLTERLQTTTAGMTINRDHGPWSEYLRRIAFAYDTATQITESFSPSMLNYGQDPVMPTEANLMDPLNSALVVRNLALQNIKKRQIADKMIDDGKHRQRCRKEVLKKLLVGSCRTMTL